VCFALEAVTSRMLQSADMPIERETQATPENEAAYDKEWIAGNTYLFARLARVGHEFLGRGAIVVNLAELTIRASADTGHPFTYTPATSADWSEAEDLRQIAQEQGVQPMLQEYNPATELVAVLVKPLSGMAYRIPLPIEEDTEIRGWYVEAEEDETRSRVMLPNPSGRDFRLASQHMQVWPYTYPEILDPHDPRT
jgi:hypothetical protein